MVWLGCILLLVGVATAAPQAAAPGSVDSTANNTTLPFIILADTLPPGMRDFWVAKEPPSTKADPKDNLVFEFMHCSGAWVKDQDKAEGDCNYLAGQVARGSELHLLMKGTRSVTGTCGLENNMHFPKGQFDNGRELENGLCHYEMDETNDEMRLSNN